MTQFRLHSCFRLPVAFAALSLVSLSAPRRSEAATIKIGCLGEQTTKTNDASFMMWPLLLGTSLGAGYNVVNEGGDTAGTILTGYTGGGNDHPYNLMGTLDQYNDALTADIVVIGPMGEHDERAVAANAALGTEMVYETDLDTMVTAFMHDSHKVVLTTPILVPSFNAATQTYVTNVVLPATKAVATKHTLPLVDLYTAFTGQTALFMGIGDGHVNADGEKKIAELVLPAIQGLAAGGGGAGGAGGTGGAGGVGGAAGAGTAGTGGVGGVGGVPAASAGAPSAGAPSAGAGGASTSGGASGAAAGGSPSAAGAGGAPIQTPTSGDDGGGCSLSSHGSRNGLGAGALFALAALALVRRRRASRQ